MNASRFNNRMVHPYPSNPGRNESPQTNDEELDTLEPVEIIQGGNYSNEPRLRRRMQTLRQLQWTYQARISYNRRYMIFIIILSLLKIIASAVVVHFTFTDYSQSISWLVAMITFDALKIIKSLLTIRYIDQANGDSDEARRIRVCSPLEFITTVGLIVLSIALFVNGHLFFVPGVYREDLFVNKYRAGLIIAYMVMFWIQIFVILFFTLIAICKLFESCIYWFRDRGICISKPKTISVTKSKGVETHFSIFKQLKIVKYHKELPGDHECSICIQGYEEKDYIGQLVCNEKHHFHENCITEWLVLRKHCPLCRKRLDEMQV